LKRDFFLCSHDFSDKLFFAGSFLEPLWERGLWSFSAARFVLRGAGSVDLSLGGFDGGSIGELDGKGWLRETGIIKNNLSPMAFTFPSHESEEENQKGFPYPKLFRLNLVLGILAVFVWFSNSFVSFEDCSCGWCNCCQTNFITKLFKDNEILTSQIIGLLIPLSAVFRKSRLALGALVWINIFLFILGLLYRLIFLHNHFKFLL